MQLLIQTRISERIYKERLQTFTPRTVIEKQKPHSFFYWWFGSTVAVIILIIYLFFRNFMNNVKRQLTE